MFLELRKQVRDEFEKMTADGRLFRVNLDRDALVDAYLDNLPPEERQQYNCNCCKSFLRQYGNLVSIDNEYNIRTLWNFQSIPMFAKSIAKMDELVFNAAIHAPFMSPVSELGTDHNFELHEGDTPIKWDHFNLKLPAQYITRGTAETYATWESNQCAIAAVAKRSLIELTQESARIIIDLMNQNSLYRGAEFKPQVERFLMRKVMFDNLSTDEKRELFAWKHAEDIGKIRNTAIGTLLIALSEGADITDAVNAFERLVAPMNYQRPTAIVTMAMITNAEKTLETLGINSALKRRFATKDDIHLSNLLFVDRGVKPNHMLNAFDTIKADMPVMAKSFEKQESVSIETFVSDILPTASGIEVLLEGKHSGNFVSLIAPTDTDAPNIFSWNNPISWDYVGHMADSIREKVKRAGGSVDGELRISLAWDNTDDLDLHVTEPNRTKIWFGQKISSTSRGQLDVDMNVSETVRNPVENVIFPMAHRMLNGIYAVHVNQYRKRESIDVGFNVEIECRGELWEMRYDKAVQHNQTIDVASFVYDGDKGITNLVSQVSSTTKPVSKEIWGVKTQRWQKVPMIMWSPNFWTDGRGNKHIFFIIEGAKNPDEARVFYNEMLKPELKAHNKVFELLGSRFHTEPSDNQLSGIGFSLTTRNELYVKVHGNVDRIIKVQF